MTLAELLAECAGTLRRAGVEAPEWDAERLLRHATGRDRAALVAAPQAAVPEAQERAFRALVAERARRVPLQHLTGSQAFWRHELRVNADVLIPRPETELLVETSLELLRGALRPVIVDVGTGSGCIALSLAAELAEAEVHATDVSEPALAVARENAEALGLAARVEFHHADLLATLEALRGCVDLVVANPPYVDATERDSLAPEVRDHEPSLALFPPGDVLSVYRRLVPAAFEWLRPGGWLALEIAPALAESVPTLMAAAGFEEKRTANDLAGRARVVSGRRPEAGASLVE
jgi:release factor glutamine methyltransferase